MTRCFQNKIKRNSNSKRIILESIVNMGEDLKQFLFSQRQIFPKHHEGYVECGVHAASGYDMYM